MNDVNFFLANIVISSCLTIFIFVSLLNWHFFQGALGTSDISSVQILILSPRVSNSGDSLALLLNYIVI